MYVQNVVRLFCVNCFYYCCYCYCLEMCDRPGEDLAYGALLLRTVRTTVWRRRFPWAGRETVLPPRLLRDVRSEVQWLQSRHYGELYIGVELAMASGLFRLSGKENWEHIPTIHWTHFCLLLCWQDCKKPVKGKSFYAMEGKPVCPGCVGVEEEEWVNESDWTLSIVRSDQMMTLVPPRKSSLVHCTPTAAMLRRR